ncbi:MAG: Ig-like domain-containing protein, partial [Kangiellaceae bacterium]|nr:Ig-like domain-containing protein [Kangiellaceae bacterium]
MVKLLLVSFLFTFLLLNPSPAFAAQPSFDCGKAGNRLEKAICDSSSLAQLDKRMAKVYAELFKSSSDNNASRKQVKQSQRRWLKQRFNCVEDGKVDNGCLAKLYQDRISELASQISHDDSKKKKLNKDKPLKVLRVTPAEGSKGLSKQVVVTFDKPVVAIGKMAVDDAKVPVSITPELACQWRWLNTSSLSCRIPNESSMAPATQYLVKVKAGLETLSGEVLNQDYEHRFTTVGPKVTYVGMYSWLSPRRPIHSVSFNMPVTADSVRQSLYYLADGKRIPVKLVPPLLQHPLPAGLTKKDEQIALGFRNEYRVDNKHITEVPDGYFSQARNRWLVLPEEILPQTERSLEREKQNAKIWKERRGYNRRNQLKSVYLLSIEPGLVTSLGGSPGNEKRNVLEFYTFPEFEFLGISCLQKSPKRRWQNTLAEELLQSGSPHRCMPQSGTSMVFTVPIPDGVLYPSMTISPELNVKKDKEGEVPRGSRHSWNTRATYRLGNGFVYSFEPMLEAYKEYQLDFEPQKLIDVFGRTIKPVDKSYIYTAHRDPKFRSQYSSAVLEHEVDSEVGAWVTNVDKVDFVYDGWYFDEQGNKQPLGSSSSGQQIGQQRYQQAFTDIKDKTYLAPVDFRKMMQGKSAVISGRMTAHSNLEGSKPFNAGEFFIQSGNLNIHAKIGYFRSSVWVTDLRTGEPVEGARVEFHKLLTTRTGGLARTKKLDLPAVVTGYDGLAYWDGGGSQYDRNDLLWDVDALLVHYQGTAAE